MRLVNGDPSTTKVPVPDDAADGSTTRVLIRPVFTREGDGRRRLLVRCGWLAAISGLAYLAMVLVSVTASPAARPTAVAAPGVAAAPTTVRQVTPERPSKVPVAPVVAAPVTTVRPRPPAAVTQAPPGVRTTTVTLTPAAPAPPSATVKPSKPAKTTAPAATKTTKPSKTPKPSRVA